MNLLLLHKHELQKDGSVILRDSRHHHIRTVLKSAARDTLKVGILNGDTGSAVVGHSNERETRLIDIHCTSSPPAKLPITLILALPRPKAARRICRTAAELGIEQLILLNSYRVEKSYWQSPLLTQEKITGYFREGLEQAGDTVLPIVQFEKRFKPFVEDQLPALCQNKRALIAHPYSDSCSPPPAPEPTILAVGPEGGFIPYEVEKLRGAGMQCMTLGQRILRVESAVPTLLAKLFP
ncbi:16S rRNA (uracil(1498)-N(3))-methyltransferase [Litorivivens sp.]|uniref:16S rRNA (uracil(1498)-N(3))-methyltransferase n=3 Tax=Litorivivens sp. TaxID=2020868 RepID=UPI00356809E0